MILKKCKHKAISMKTKEIRKNGENVMIYKIFNIEII